jgi:hypothetical protein
MEKNMQAKRATSVCPGASTTGRGKYDAGIACRGTAGQGRVCCVLEQREIGAGVADEQVYQMACPPRDPRGCITSDETSDSSQILLRFSPCSLSNSPE